MKIVFLIMTIFITVLLAEYNNDNSGKIDMHGGKASSLVGENKGFSNKSFSLKENSFSSKLKESKDNNSSKR